MLTFTVAVEVLSKEADKNLCCEILSDDIIQNVAQF